MVDKITNPITNIELIDKTNEIIDNLCSGSGLSYSATCPAITPVSGVATWSVTHNLGTQNVIVSLYKSGALQECNVVTTSNNALTITFKASSNISAGDYSVVVLASGGEGGGSADDTFNGSGLNVNIIGSLTNNNGVISGFNTAPSYAATLVSYTLGTNFEFGIKFTTTSTVPSDPEQLVSDNGYPAFNINISNQKLTCQIGTTDAWDLDSFVTSTTTLQTSTTYWVKFVYQNSQTKLYMSTDGVTYNLEATSTSSVSVPNITIYLGTGRYLNYPFLGSIDLDDTYLKINGSLVWQGASYKSLTSLAPVTDYYVSGTSWYKETFSDSTRTNRIWLDQGGTTSLLADYATANITLLKPFSNNNYTVTCAAMMPSTGDDGSWNNSNAIRYATRTPLSFQIYSRGAADNGRYICWRACGI